MRSHPDGRWRGMPSQHPFTECFGPEALAFLEQAFEKALERVDGRADAPNGDADTRLIIAERIMALAATGETHVNRLVAHAIKAFPRFANHEAISRRAYEIWEREGRPEGRDREHWEQAIGELVSSKALPATAARR